jgi:DNA helicase-2/ATP-dependent DNA helicase PcrA
LDQLELLASRFRSRSTMLSDLTLDPPNSTQDLAGNPVLDEDYLVLSTIHSAKGLEWDAVYVIHAVDGNIPADKATGTKEQLDEELRLFYVALTRAKRSLTVCVPLAYHLAARGPWTDRHSYAQRTRFIPKELTRLFDCRATRGPVQDPEASELCEPSVAEGVRRRLSSMWS